MSSSRLMRDRSKSRNVYKDGASPHGRHGYRTDDRSPYYEDDQRHGWIFDRLSSDRPQGYGNDHRDHGSGHCFQQPRDGSRHRYRLPRRRSRSRRRRSMSKPSSLSSKPVSSTEISKINKVVMPFRNFLIPWRSHILIFDPCFGVGFIGFPCHAIYYFMCNFLSIQGYLIVVDATDSSHPSR